MPLRHNLLAVSVALLWGVNFVAIDVGLETFPPLLFVALRFALTAFPAVLFVRRPAVATKWIVAVGFFLSVGQFGLLFVAIHIGMPAGLSSLVVQLQAVFTIALAVALLGERPSRVQLSGAAVAFSGLAVVSEGRAQSVPLVGVLLVVGAAASWGVSNVCTRVAKPADGFAFLIWASLVGAIPLTGLSFAFEGSSSMAHAFTSLGWAAVLSLLYVVVISTFFGFGAWTFLLARHSASDVAPFSLLAPVAALVSTWLARGERPTAAELAGGIVILVGLALAVVPRPTTSSRKLKNAHDAAVTSPS
jgi:O-acetylserine/cysteine efflux transporter